MGALTTFKIPDTSLFWAAIFAFPNTKVNLRTFVASNNSIALGGTTFNTVGGSPQFIRISTGSDTIPSLEYTAFFGPNANSDGRILSSLFDSTNNRTIMVGFQEANRSNNIVNCGMVRVFNSNNSLYASFLDPSDSVFNERTLGPAALDSLGNIIATGVDTSAPGGYFVVNYTQTGTKNWIKTFTGFPSNVAQLGGIFANNSTLIAGSNSTAYTATAAILNSSGNSFTNQFTLTGNDGGDVSVDTTGNIYFAGANSTQRKFTKFNTTSNSASWTLTTNSPNAFSDSTFYDGNVYVRMVDSSFPNLYDNKIISIDANTGNVNWKNEYRFTGTGIYNFNQSTSVLSLSANNQGLFVLNQLNSSNTTRGGSVLLKLPLDGSIPGTGTYSLISSGANTLNLDIRTSSITIGTGSVGITSSNVGLANANSVSTINSNIAANTTQTYTYNQSLLN
jgi:hypothetical protein